MVHCSLLVSIHEGQVDSSVCRDIPVVQHVHDVGVMPVNSFVAFCPTPEFVLEGKQLVVAFHGVQRAAWIQSFEQTQRSVSGERSQFEGHKGANHAGRHGDGSSRLDIAHQSAMSRLLPRGDAQFTEQCRLWRAGFCGEGEEVHRGTKIAVQQKTSMQLKRQMSLDIRMGHPTVSAWSSGDMGFASPLSSPLNGRRGSKHAQNRWAGCPC